MRHSSANGGNKLHRDLSQHILIASQAAPDLSTAYARVGRELAIWLAQYRKVTLLGCHGNVASQYTLEQGDARVPVLPYPWAFFEATHVNQIAKDIGASLILFVGDAWPYARQILDGATSIPWVLMSPVDHAPLIPAEKLLAEGVAAWAAPTHWGTQAINDAAPGKGHYVPHGVSKGLLAKLEPLRPGQQTNAIDQLGWDHGVTRYLTVSNNVGDRKNLAGLIRAWHDAELLNAELVLWCYPTRDGANPDGYDLIGAASELGITNIRFPDPYQVSVGYSDGDLGLVYAACDAYIQCSKTEGFGIPIAEAQAIGIPAIVTRFDPFLEVAGVSADDPLTLPIGSWELMQLLGTAWMPTPSTQGIVDALQHFHANGIDEDEMNRRHDHAFAYNWPDAAARMDAVIGHVLQAKNDKTLNGRLVAAPDSGLILPTGVNLP